MALTPPTSSTARDFASILSDIESRLTAIEVGLRTGQLGNSSLENSGLNAYDSSGNLRYTVGLQEDGNYAAISKNNPNPPPVPSQAVVIPGKGTLTIRYEGETADGVGLPTDWQNANVYLAPPSGTYTKIGTIISAPGDFIAGDLEYQTYSVKLTNVNYSGKESGFGAATTGTPVQVVSNDIIDGIITETKLAADSVTAAKVAVNAIGTGKIQDSAISLAKLGDGSVSASKIIDGAVQSGKIAASAVGANEIAANSIVSGNIAANGIQAVNLAAGSVIAGKLAVDSVQAGNIVASAVTSDKIAALNITGDKIAANAIDAGKISAGSITASKLQSDLVIATRIIAGDATGARVEIHPTAGLQAFTGTGVKTVWIDSATGNITATGTFASGYDGERIVILTDGTMRFYPATGTKYAQIANNGTNILFSGITDSSNRSGFITMSATGITTSFGIPTGTITAGFNVTNGSINAFSPYVKLRVDGRTAAGDGGTRRVEFAQTNSSGTDISASIINYYARSTGSRAVLISPVSGVGFVWDAGAIAVTEGDATTHGPIVASAFNNPSSRRFKMKEDKIRFGSKRDKRAKDIVKVVDSKEWEYIHEQKGSRPAKPLVEGNPDAEWDWPEKETPKHYGPMAEDLAAVAPSLVRRHPTDSTMVYTDVRDLVGVVWKAVQELLGEVETMQSQIEAMQSQVRKAGESE